MLRLKQILDRESIRISEAAKSAELPRSVLSKILNNNDWPKKLPRAQVEKIRDFMLNLERQQDAGQLAKLLAKT